MLPQRTPLQPDPDTGESLEELVREIATGSEPAMSRLYDQVAPNVLGICRRVLVDVSAAEEATMDVFLQVWRTASRFDSTRGSALAWIATMARTRSIDRLRSLRTNEEASLECEAERTADESRSSNPEIVAFDQERREVVRSALSRVSTAEREALDFAFFHGLTYREIAEKTRIPLGTVKTRIRSGLAKLRNMLAPLSPEAGELT